MLTAAVFVAAISISIWDYAKEKHSKPWASTPTAVEPNAVGLAKKTTSSKTRRARISATEGNVSATARAKTRVVSDNAPNTVRAQTARNEISIAMDQSEGNELQTKVARPTLSGPYCVPLPNGSKLGDADAGYYRNWAIEYGCLF
jgi:hypothetical protein